MEPIDYIYAYVGIAITLYIHLMCYKALSNNDKPNKVIYISLPVLTLLSLLNTFMNYTYSKLAFSIVIIILNNFLAYGFDNKKVILKSIIIYIVSVIFEIILAIPFALSSIKSIIDFDNNVAIKNIFSFVIILLTYLFCSRKWFIDLVNGKLNKIKDKCISIGFLIVSLVMVIFLAYKFIFSFSPSTYVFNLVIITCFTILSVYIIISFNKIDKIEKEQAILLDFMTKYEKIIDDNRINRHEMLNNLLILKSYKNRNTIEYSSLLDELINIYNTKGETYRNIYNLPSGLKGIIYYKINDMKSLGITINIKIGKNVEMFFKKYTNDNYSSICKIIASLLDNSKDAASTAKDKLVMIDFIVDNNKMTIIIENTFKNKINLDKIKNKNHSTKGKGRGLGLYIVNNLINSSNNIALEQRIIDDVYFQSSLIIKNETN